MKPEKQPKIPQEDLFRMRLENMLDINHELIKLSKHIDWESPDKEWGTVLLSTKVSEPVLSFPGRKYYLSSAVVVHNILPLTRLKWLETGQWSYLKLMRQWAALFLKLFGDNPFIWP